MKDLTPDMSLDLLNLPFLTESTPAKPARPTRRGRPPRSSLPNGRWAESFADDLVA